MMMMFAPGSVCDFDVLYVCVLNRLIAGLLVFKDNSFAHRTDLHVRGMDLTSTVCF